MARASLTFSNFTAGRLSSRLDGRTDLAKYFNGCTALTNFMVHPHGGATRRPGTYFVAEVKTSSKATRLIPFEFNTDHTYIIELGDQYMRFFTNNGQIVEGDVTISGATQANPVVVTATGHGYSNGEEITISSVSGMTQLNGKRYLVANKTTNTFEITDKDGTNINGSGYTAYGSGGVANRVYEISSPFLEAELFDVKFAQSADTMWLVHPSHFPRKLTRTGNTAWTIAVAPIEYGPMQDENTEDTTLTASARTGASCTLTASASTFASTDVDRLVKIHDGWVNIDTYTSVTEVTGTVKDNLDGRAELLPEYTASTISFVEGDPSATGAEHNDRIVDTAKNFVDQGFAVGHTVTVSGTSSNNGDYLIVDVTDDTILVSPSDDLAAESAGSSFTIVGKLEATDEWALGAFSATTGYPSAVCFFEERLVYAGTTDQPQTVFFSESGGFDQFADGADDGDAMIYSIASSQVNKVRYLSPGRVLIIGTSGAEFAAQGSSANEPITPTSIQIKRQTTYGTATVSPIQSGNAVLFLQRAQRKVRELVYNFDVDGYIAPDMTLLAEDITDGGIVDMDMQQEPDNVLWCCRADGALLGMTYRREENVVAWHKHDLGGKAGSCTVTYTDYANLPVGSTLKFTKSNGETVTYTSEANGGSAPSDTTYGWRNNESNDTSADNLYTRITASSSTTGLTCENPAANIVTITETARAGTAPLTVVSSDTTRMAVTSQTGAIAESVAVIPGDIDEDQVWLLTQKNINSVSRRHVEFLTPQDFGAVEDAFFVDSGLTYSGSATTSISGLDHLNGEAVVVLADGATHANKTVSSGAITLDRSAVKVHVGLSYTSTLRTMRVEGGAIDGSSQGKIKRIHDVTVRFFQTIGAKVGPSSSSLDLIPFRSSADEMDEALGLYTGDKEIEFKDGYTTDGYITVVQDQPLPMTVLAIFARLQTFDA